MSPSLRIYLYTIHIISANPHIQHALLEYKSYTRLQNNPISGRCYKEKQKI